LGWFEVSCYFFTPAGGTLFGRAGLWGAMVFFLCSFAPPAGGKPDCFWGGGGGAYFFSGAGAAWGGQGKGKDPKLGPPGDCWGGGERILQGTQQAGWWGLTAVGGWDFFPFAFFLQRLGSGAPPRGLVFGGGGGPPRAQNTPFFGEIFFFFFFFFFFFPPPPFFFGFFPAEQKKKKKKRGGFFLLFFFFFIFFFCFFFFFFFFPGFFFFFFPGPPLFWGGRSFLSWGFDCLHFGANIEKSRERALGPMEKTPTPPPRDFLGFFCRICGGGGFFVLGPRGGTCFLENPPTWAAPCSNSFGIAKTGRIGFLFFYQPGFLSGGGKGEKERGEFLVSGGGWGTVGEGFFPTGNGIFGRGGGWLGLGVLMVVGFGGAALWDGGHPTGGAFYLNFYFFFFFLPFGKKNPFATPNFSGAGGPVIREYPC